MTSDDVLRALSNVQEPDLGKDLVTLNMVRDIAISGNTVSFTVVLTTPACPLKEEIKNACINAVKILVNKEAAVTVHFTSSTTTLRADKNTVLPGVKNIIAVVSGKGGVGKSTVAANLALALAKGGAQVGLMDADIYGPSVPIMFGVRGERPMMKEQNGKGVIVPLERYGIKLMSIGLLVDEKSAVVWRGPMASSAIKQFVTDVAWEELDYLVIDMPPGTGDIHLTLMQTVPVTGCGSGHHPAGCGTVRCKERDSHVWPGAVERSHNRIGGKHELLYPAELPRAGIIFLEKKVAKRLAKNTKLPFLGQIPLVQSIREGGDQGRAYQ
jgi:ATP-binding protein involved in chromosome partitioning